MEEHNTQAKDESSTSSDAFDADLVRKYPKSNRKITIGYAPYGIKVESTTEEKATSIHISPHGVEFQTSQAYAAGTLLKISVTLPDYWTRKQKFVDYSRVDAPGEFRILAKVVQSEDVGKRGRKKRVVAQTVNMDEIDEQVLKAFLQE